MNGPDHYREAERLLDEAISRGDFNHRAEWCLELAKLHTALAHVAATAQTSDGREWVRAAGPWFSDISLALHEQDVGSVSAKVGYLQSGTEPAIRCHVPGQAFVTSQERFRADIRHG